jgi:EmrB/QacA subfamily drug resistance transporter
VSTTAAPTGAAPAGLTSSSRRGRWVIAATVIGSGMAQLDGTAVSIALPRIGVDFGVGVASLQWVVTSYSLTLSALLLLGGSLGDRLGRRRMFELGTVWFAAASALCALAPNAPVLIAARGLQGIGGALLTPGSLAILQASFRDADRGRAIGAWSGLGGLASAAGPLVGGWLLAVASWRWVFVINVPLAVGVVVISRRHLPESFDPTAAGRVDLPGAGSLVLALSSLTFALIEAPGRGWSDPLIIGGFVVGIVAAAGFVLIERRISNPMLPPGMFASRQFNATNAVTFLVYGALGATLFLLPVALEQVQGYSPLAAGTSLLPVTALMLLLAARSGELAARIGPRLQMSVGPAVVGLGLGLLALVTVDGFYPVGVLPGIVLLGIGLVITVAPLTSTAMSSAPAEHTGLASAVNNDVARAAALVAVATVPVVSSLTGDAYLHPAVFAAGFRVACIICGASAIAGGILAAVTIRNPGRAGATGRSGGRDDCGQPGGGVLPPVPPGSGRVG